jgi:predicted dehydrogenase
MAKIRIGIIGTGNISHSHMDGYRQLGQVEVVAACDINRDRVKAYAKQYGIPHVFTDYNEMLEMKDIDAVSVCTWNNVHAAASIAALRAGKHVLCEKPLSMTVAEAEAIGQEAEKANRLLMVGFVMRFEQKAMLLHDWIKAGHFGQIYYAKAAYLRRAGNPGGWFADKTRSGGGPLIDLGVHIIDIGHYLMGKPALATASGATFNKLGYRENLKGVSRYTASDAAGVSDVEDMAVAFLRFADGSVMEVETSYSQHIGEDTFTFECFGTKGGFSYEPELKVYSEMENYLVDLKPKLAPEDDAASFRREIAHFADCAAGKASCVSPAADGVGIMRILCAIYESARLGKEISL